MGKYKNRNKLWGTFPDDTEDNLGNRKFCFLHKTARYIITIGKWSAHAFAFPRANRLSSTKRPVHPLKRNTIPIHFLTNLMESNSPIKHHSLLHQSLLGKVHEDPHNWGGGGDGSDLRGAYPLAPEPTLGQTADGVDYVQAQLPGADAGKPQPHVQDALGFGAGVFRRALETGAAPPQLLDAAERPGSWRSTVRLGSEDIDIS